MREPIRDINSILKMAKQLHFFCCSMLSLLILTSCHRDEEKNRFEETVDFCWEYAQHHPDGFTLNISNYSVPGEGIVVSYQETQNSFGKEGLREVVLHSLAHNQIVGGWHNDVDGKYYFDSDTIFQEDMFHEAIIWAKQNKQHSIFILSRNEEIRIEY